MTACHTLNGLDERRPGATSACSSAAPAELPVHAARHHGLPSLPRTGLPDGLPGGRLRERSRSPASSSTWTTSASAASTARWPVPTTCPKYHAGKGIVRKCDMCATGWPWAKRPPACRPARTRRSRIRVVDVAAGDRANAEADRFCPRARPADHVADDALSTTRASSRATCCRPTTTPRIRSIRTGR